MQTQTPETHEPSFDVMKLHRINECKAKPIWNVPDVCLMFGISQSTFEITIRKTPLRGMFTIGRIRCCQQEAAYQWLEDLKEANAYESQRQYNKRAA